MRAMFLVFDFQGFVRLPNAKLGSFSQSSLGVPIWSATSYSSNEIPS